MNKKLQSLSLIAAGLGLVSLTTQKRGGRNILSRKERQQYRQSIDYYLSLEDGSGSMIRQVWLLQESLEDELAGRPLITAKEIVDRFKAKTNYSWEPDHINWILLDIFKGVGFENMTSLSAHSLSDDFQYADAIPYLTNVKKIYFQSCNYQKPPTFLCKMPQLEKIVFTYCGALEEITPEFCNALPNLRELHMDECGNFETLPSEIDQLTKLQNLGVNNSYEGFFTTIPASIGNLLNLKHIHFAYNDITEIPDLSRLLSLKTVNFYSNEIEHIPQSLVTLAQMYNVKIYMDHNPVQKVCNLLQKGNYLYWS